MGVIPAEQIHAFADELQKTAIIRELAERLGKPQLGARVADAMERPFTAAGEGLVRGLGLHKPVTMGSVEHLIPAGLEPQTHPAAKSIRSGMKLLAKNPEILPMQAVPIPGITEAWTLGVKPLINRALTVR